MDEKKSKYFRSPDDETRSKYIKEKPKKERISDSREKNEKKSNKHVKQTYADNVITPEKQRILQEQLEAEQEKALSESEETVEAAEVEEPAEEKTRSKGSAKSIFEIAAKERVFNGAKAEPNDDYKKRATTRLVLSVAALTIVAIILRFLYFRIPYLPSMISLDFAVVPELIGSIAFGPLVGMAIVFIKNIASIIFMPGNYLNALYNFAVDSFFVVIASVFYSRIMFSKKKGKKSRKSKDKRRLIVFMSGIVSALLTMVIVYVLTAHFSYPLLIKTVLIPKGYDERYIIDMYQDSLSTINAHLPSFLAYKIATTVGTISRGIILFNVPVAFVRLFLSTCITAVIYNPLSDFIHYRKK